MERAKNTGKQPMTVDIEQMPDTPQRGSHHRRAHSDTSFRFDDLLLFDPSDLDLSSLDLPTPTAPRGAAAPMAVDSSDDSTSNGVGGQPTSHKPKPINHLRSLSVDSDFFDGLGLTAGGGDEKFGGKAVATAAAAGEKRVHHRHSISMDGSSLASFEAESLMVDGVKKAMAPDRLAELSLIDPKRAKRFDSFFFPSFLITFFYYWMNIIVEYISFIY